MVIILVGPSKVGKTTLSGKITKKIEAAHLDMDLKATGKDKVEKAKAMLKEKDLEPMLYILDFGADFQNFDATSYNLFSPYANKMITILADEAVVHRRHGQRDKEEFLRTEFRENRKRIYDMSAYRLNTTKDEDKDAETLLTFIEGIIVNAYPGRTIIKRP
jgi:hypothetical protein